VRFIINRHFHHPRILFRFKIPRSQVITIIGESPGKNWKIHKLQLNSFMIFYSYIFHGRSSRNLHIKMTKALIKSPVLFFDTNPLGRIINRFSSDTGNLDDRLSCTTDSSLAYGINAFAVALVAMATNPWFLVAIVPLGTFVVYYSRYFVRNSREISRLQAVSKSPIYEHFSETVRGLEVIRSLRMKEEFTSKIHRYHIPLFVKL